MIASPEDANRILSELRNRPDAFMFAPDLLKQECSMFVKLTALILVNDAIENRWESVPPDDRNNIRVFLIDFVIGLAKTQGRIELINKANQAIVNIAKWEWPGSWPDFIPSMVSVASGDRNVCLNFLKIIGLLADAILGLSDEGLTSLRAFEMNTALKENIESVMSVFTMAVQTDDVELVKNAISFLKKILRLEEIKDVLKGNRQLFTELIERFVQNEALTVDVIGLMGDLIAATDMYDGAEAEVMCVNMVKALHKRIGDDISMMSSLSCDDRFSEGFLQAMKLFCLRHWAVFFHMPPEIVGQILNWAYKISVTFSTDNIEVWVKFWSTVFRFMLQTTGFGGTWNDSPVIKSFALQVAELIIEVMPAPLKVVVYADDENQAHKDIEDCTTWGATFFEAVSCLNYICTFGKAEVLQLFMNRIAEIKSDPTNVCSVFWALGGMLTRWQVADYEKEFPNILMSILELYSAMPTPEEKASMAECFVFVCSSCARFLCKYLVVLKSVVEKIVGFMSEPIGQLQEYCLSALSNIFCQCRREVTVVQSGEQGSLLNYIGSNLTNILERLHPDLWPTMYQTYAELIRTVSRVETETEATRLINSLIGNMLETANTLDWQNEAIIQKLLLICRCESEVSMILSDYFKRLFQPHLEMVLQLYRRATEVHCHLFQSLGPKTTTLYKSLKDSLLKLVIGTLADCGEDLAAQGQDRLSMFSELVAAIIDDYAAYPVARVPNVLVLCEQYMGRLFAREWTDLQASLVPILFNKIMDPTFEMLRTECDNYEQFASGFVALASVCGSDFVERYSWNEMANTALGKVLNYLEFTARSPMASVRDSSLDAIGNICGHWYLGMEDADGDGAQLPFMSRYGLKILAFAFEMLFDVTYKSSITRIMNIILQLNVYKSIGELSGEITKMLCGLLPGRPPEEIGQAVEALILSDQTGGRVDGAYAILKELLVKFRPISRTDPDLDRAEEIEAVARQVKEKVHSAVVPGRREPQVSPMEPGEAPVMDAESQRIKEQLGSFSMGYGG